MFRAINPTGYVMLLAAVTSECHNCMHPIYSQAIAPLSATGYFPFYCGKPWSVQVNSTDDRVVFTSALTLNAVEHGWYSVMVNVAAVNVDGGAPGGVTSVTDVAGTFPYTPLIAAGVALTGLFFLHKLLVLAIIRCGWYPASMAEAARGGKKGDDDGITVWAMFGLDRAFRRASAAAAASAAARSDDMAETTYRSPLMATAPLIPAGVSPFSAPLSVNNGARALDAPIPAAASSEGKGKSGTKPRSAGRIRSIDALRGVAVSRCRGGGGGGGGRGRSRLCLASVLVPIRAAWVCSSRS